MEVYKPWDFCKERNCYGIGEYPDKEKRKKHYCKRCGAYSMHQYLKRHGQILEEGSDITFQLAEAQADNAEILDWIKAWHKDYQGWLDGDFDAEDILSTVGRSMEGVITDTHPGAALLTELEYLRKIEAVAYKLRDSYGKDAQTKMQAWHEFEQALSQAKDGDTAK